MFMYGFSISVSWLPSSRYPLPAGQHFDHGYSVESPTHGSAGEPLDGGRVDPISRRKPSSKMAFFKRNLIPPTDTP